MKGVITFLAVVWISAVAFRTWQKHTRCRNENCKQLGQPVTDTRHSKAPITVVLYPC